MSKKIKNTLIEPVGDSGVKNTLIEPVGASGVKNTLIEPIEETPQPLPGFEPPKNYHPELDIGDTPEEGELKPMLTPLKDPNPRSPDPGKAIAMGGMAGLTAPVSLMANAGRVLETVFGVDVGFKDSVRLVKRAKEFWREKIGDTETDKLLGSASESLGSMAAYAATTGNVLAPMAIGAGTEKTVESQEQGANKWDAYSAGLMTFGSSYLTNYLPQKIAFDKTPFKLLADNFMLKYITGAGTDTLGNIADTAIKMEVIDRGLLHTPVHYSAKDYAELLKETLAVSLMTTATLHVANKGINVGRDVDVLRALDTLSIKDAPPVDRSQYIAPDEAFEYKNTTRDGAPMDVPPPKNLELKISPEGQEAISNLPVSKEKSAWRKYQDASLNLRPEKKVGKKLSKVILDEFVGHDRDIVNALKKTGDPAAYRAVQLKVLSEGMDAAALHETKAIKKEVFGGLKHDEKINFFRYMQNVSRAESWYTAKEAGRNFDLPEGVTIDQITNEIKILPKEVKENYGKRIIAWSNKAVAGTLAESLKSELISPKEAEDMRRAHLFYTTTEYINKLDPSTVRVDKTGKRMSVHDSGYETLEGSNEYANMNYEELLDQMYIRTFKRVAKNNMNRAMAEFARRNPNNGIVSVNDVTSPVPKGKTRFYFREHELYSDKGPKNPKQKLIETKAPATVTEDALMPEKVNIRSTVRALDIDNSLAEGWSSPPGGRLPKELVPIVEWVSGAAMVRITAVKYSPTFWATNILRDTPLILMSTQEYSNFLPLATLQIGNDMRAVAKEVLLGKGKYYDAFMKLGGSMSSSSPVTSKGVTTKYSPTGKAVNKIEEISLEPARVSETLSRVALYKRGIDNGLSPQEAAYKARNYMDFAQGGQTAKDISHLSMFFSPGIQAVRGVARATKEHPIATTSKALQVMAIGAAVYLAQKKVHEIYDEEGNDTGTVDKHLAGIPDETRANYFNILTPYTVKNELGEEQRYYIKIPKEKTQGVLAQAGEMLAKKALGKKLKDGDVDAFIASIKETIKPGVPGASLPPAMTAIYGVLLNKDFWSEKDIWTKPPVRSSKEYYENTPGIYKRIGELTDFDVGGKDMGISPVKLQYAVKNYFGNNFWTKIAGEDVQAVMNELSPEDRQAISDKDITKNLLIRPFVGLTNPDIARKKEIESVKISQNTKRLMVKNDLRAQFERENMSEAQFVSKETQDRVKSYVENSEAPQDIKNMVVHWYRTTAIMKGVKNKGFFYDLQGLEPEAAATQYYATWETLDAKSRKTLDDEMLRAGKAVPIVKNPRFRKVLFELKGRQNK